VVFDRVVFDQNGFWSSGFRSWGFQSSGFGSSGFSIKCRFLLLIDIQNKITSLIIQLHTSRLECSTSGNPKMIVITDWYDWL
jgi:hypothetical protein